MPRPPHPTPTQRRAAELGHRTAPPRVGRSPCGPPQGGPRRRGGRARGRSPLSPPHLHGARAPPASPPPPPGPVPPVAWPPSQLRGCDTHGGQLVLRPLTDLFGR